MGANGRRLRRGHRRRSRCSSTPASTPPRVERRPSSGGKYLGLTVTVTATSREQLDELYRTLSHAPDGQGGAVSARAGAAPRAASPGPRRYAADDRGDARLHRGAHAPTPPTRSGSSSTTPVYTQGLAGKRRARAGRRRHPGGATNRGGQVTYHGPGPGGGLPAGRPAAPGHLRQGIRLPRSSRRCSRRWRPSASPATACAGAPGIYVRLADPVRPRRAGRRRAGAGDPFAAWARSPRWASRSAATAPTTAWR